MDVTQAASALHEFDLDEDDAPVLDDAYGLDSGSDSTSFDGEEELLDKHEDVAMGSLDTERRQTFPWQTFVAMAALELAPSRPATLLWSAAADQPLRDAVLAIASRRLVDLTACKRPECAAVTMHVTATAVTAETTDAAAAPPTALDASGSSEVLTLYGVVHVAPLPVVHASPAPDAEGGASGAPAAHLAVLCVTREPYYQCLQPLLRQATEALLTAARTDAAGLAACCRRVLAPCFHALSASQPPHDRLVPVAASTIPVHMPRLPAGVPEAGSVTGLLQAFGQDAMALWSAVLLQQRVLFVGNDPSVLAELCLTAPILVAPLPADEVLRHVHPLVSLEDVSPLEASTYVCGAVNPMFQLRTRKYDIMAVVAGGKLLRQRAAELNERDKQFIDAVCQGVQDGKGEAWAREQFRQHTIAFVRDMERALAEQQVAASGSARVPVGSLLWQQLRVAQSPLWAAHLRCQAAAAQEREAAVTQRRAGMLRLLRTMRALPLPQWEMAPLPSRSGTPTGDPGTTLDVPPSLAASPAALAWVERLDRMLLAEDAAAACAEGAVDVCMRAAVLQHAQTRETALRLLHRLQCAAAAPATRALASHAWTLLTLLAEPWPGAVQAAAACLLGLCGTPHGAAAVAEVKSAPRVLCAVVCSPESDSLCPPEARLRAGDALLALYRHCPHLPQLDPAPFVAAMQQSCHPVVLAQLRSLLSLCANAEGFVSGRRPGDAEKV